MAKYFLDGGMVPPNKSIAELEAAVEQTREDVRSLGYHDRAYFVKRELLDAYASAVRALTWAKAREAVALIRCPDDEYDREVDIHNTAIDDAITALRDAEERDK